MATYYSTSCPYCGTVFYHGTTKEDKSFGITQKICNHCGREFMYSSIYEWENLTNEEKKSVLILGADRAVRLKKDIKKSIFACALCFFLIYPLYYLIIHIKDYKAFKKFEFYPEQISQNKLIQESIQRTQDPEYRTQLLKLGRTFYGTEYTPD